MKGWARRKVTRNLGKGGGISRVNQPGVHNTDSKITPNPWTWFNADPPTYPVKLVIVDNDNLVTEIDEAYRDEGVANNWLHFTGAVIRNDTQVITYKLVCATYKPF